MSEKMVEVAYGKSSIPINLSSIDANWQTIRPDFEKASSNPKREFSEVCSRPVGSTPLKDLVKLGEKVVIVTCDGTRPVPNHLLVPWLLDEINVPLEDISVLLGTGTHRPNTPEEIREMFGPDIPEKLKIINHNCFEASENQVVGSTASFEKVSLNKLYVEADKRIILGFIEPHFFAGFSGGAKAVVPGIADLDTIFHTHRAQLIADSKSTWGVIDDNPVRQEIEAMVALCPPDFMINVTLNSDKEITAIFAGDYLEAHKQGYEQVRKNAMSAVKAPFPIVITSNSGFPLDQNLYQAVKGVSAAAEIVAEGGVIILVAECSDGIPEHGSFAKLMRKGNNPEEIAAHILKQSGHTLDQWTAQILAKILKKATVLVKSSIPSEDIESMKMRSIDDVESTIREYADQYGNGVPIAILPDGPLSIPYIS